MRRILLALILTGIGSRLAKCQAPCFAATEEINKIRNNRVALLVESDPQKKQTLTNAIGEEIRHLVNIDQMTNCLVMVGGAPPSVAALIKQFENSRNDEQEGSSSGTGGATSLVSKGPAAEVISLASEYGALTQSVNDQTVTVKGNLANLPYALVKQGILPACALSVPYLPKCSPNGYLAFLSRFSFGVTFDTSRGNQSLTAMPQTAASGASSAQPVVFQAQSQQISQVTGRVELLDHRDFASQSFSSGLSTAAGKTGLKTAADNLQKAAGSVRDAVEKDSGYGADPREACAILVASPLAADASWRSSAAKDLCASADEDLEKVWLLQMSKLIGLLRSHNSDIDALIAKAKLAYSAFFAAEQQTVDQLSMSSVIAAEYTNDRPLAQPDTSTFRLIVDAPFKKKWKFIANGAFTIYDALPAGSQGQVKRFRDAQAAAELSYSLGQNSVTGPAAVSLAGYYQDQRTAAILDVDPTNPILGVSFVGLSSNATTVLAETGNIGLVQLKLTLGGSSSVKVPLAVSYSNRTDLLNKPTWRAQIGITYNLDSLFTK